MRISKWKHPIRHWRCVHTSPCRECKHATLDLRRGCSHYGCTNPRVISYTERTSGVHYNELDASSVRGTRWCDFKPIDDEEGADDKPSGRDAESLGSGA